MEAARRIASQIVKLSCESDNLLDANELSNFDLKVAAVCRNVFVHYPHLQHLNGQIQSFADRAVIDYLITKCYNLFITGYPATKATIVAFRQLMHDNDWYGRDLLTIELVKHIEERLLHIGVNTADILKGYAAAVESLALFDASFVLVHRVCRPIRDYVKARPDTMRTIIKYITTEKPGNTTSANNKLTLILNEEQLSNVNDEYVIAVDDNAENRWFKWRPDPVDADPRESRLYRESADVFNMLVSVYGSKDLFVQEYEKLLAERLRLNGWGKHLFAELMYLETMKKRFTQGELNNCEVMIRDVLDAGQLAKECASQLPFPVTAKVISSAFWPEVPAANEFMLHPIFKSPLATFERTFRKRKRNRELNWLFVHEPSVELELEVNGVEIALEAPLLHVQVLLPFLEKERLNLMELCEECQLSEANLKRCIDWWCERGVLVRRNLDATLSESYSITADTAQLQQFAKQLADQRAAYDGFMQSDDEEEEEVEEIPIETQVEELEQFWLYTRNIICFQSTSEQPVTLARLATVYKNIVSPGKPPPSIEAITLFMQQKVRQNLVTFDNGAYRPTAELRRM